MDRFGEISRRSEASVNNVTENRNTINPQRLHDNHKLRNFLSFWLFGLCSGYGTTVILSAAYDIIQKFDSIDYEKSVHFLGPLYLTKKRDCIPKSTGIFLLADTIPSLLIKLITSFLPLYINVNVTLACVLTTVGFAVVATAEAEWIALVGIVFTSFGGGLSESSSFAYTTKFDKNVILAVSSGLGAAGVFAALSYTALIDYGFKPKLTLQIMLLVPLLQLIIFYFGMIEPSSDELTTTLLEEQNEINVQQSPSFTQKLRYFPHLLKYVIPLFSVFVWEYVINQGLYDLIFIPNSWLDQASQYRWLQVIYQVGVFVARTSFALFSIKYIWAMSVLQLINLIFFTFQVLYVMVPTLWIIFAMVFWEGCLSGFAAINTFNRVATELPIQYKSFGMSLTAISSTLGIVFAGFFAILVHNEICNTPVPSVLNVFN